MARVSGRHGNAADEIERVRATLAAHLQRCRQEGFHVDPARGGDPADKAKVGDPIYALQQADLESASRSCLLGAQTGGDAVCGRQHSIRPAMRAQPAPPTPALHCPQQAVLTRLRSAC